MFSFSFAKIKEKILSFIKPSIYMSGLSDVLKLWRSADAKDKGILLLVFSPMFLCIGGFVFSVIHFVLFVLPSFVFGIFGWGLLTVLFCSGGKYFYKHLTGNSVSNKEEIIDVQFKDSNADSDSDSDSDSDIDSEPEPERITITNTNTTPKRPRKRVNAE